MLPGSGARGAEGRWKSGFGLEWKEFRTHQMNLHLHQYLLSSVFLLIVRGQLLL